MRSGGSEPRVIQGLLSWQRGVQAIASPLLLEQLTELAFHPASLAIWGSCGIIRGCRRCDTPCGQPISSARAPHAGLLRLLSSYTIVCTIYIRKGTHAAVSGGRSSRLASLPRWRLECGRGPDGASGDRKWGAGRTAECRLRLALGARRPLSALRTQRTTCCMAHASGRDTPLTLEPGDLCSVSPSVASSLVRCHQDQPATRGDYGLRT